MLTYILRQQNYNNQLGVRSKMYNQQVLPFTS